MRSRTRFAVIGASLALLFAFVSAGSAHADRRQGRRIALPSHGSHSVLAPLEGRGHFGAEIEGIVTGVDTGAGTLSVTDQRLGPVVVTVDDSTVIRHGGTIMALGDIALGARVHAKAAPQDGGGFLAAAIFVQNDGTGGSESDTEVQGTVKAIDCGANTMTVTTDSGDVAVTIDPSTTFRKQGNAVACADIAVGDIVEVSGAAQGDGSVIASKVSIESPDAEDTEISGVVKSIDCGSNTMVVTTDSGDVTVTFDGSTVFTTHHQAAACGDVAVGDAVEVSGALQGDGSILAAKVDFEAPEVEETEVSGTIDTIDTGAQTFVLTTDSGPVTIATNSGTVIQEDHSAKTFGDLVSGMSVEVDGILQGDGSILATKISIEGPGD